LILPVAGIVQMLLVSAWQTWQAQHPEHFPEVASGVTVVTVPAVEANGSAPQPAIGGAQTGDR
jgi:hypothetical protein